MSDSAPVKNFRGAFQTSTRLAMKAAYDQTKHNPLQFLHPCEILAAEIFVGVEKDPETRATFPKGKERKWSGLQSGAFGTRWKTRMGFDLTFQNRKALEANPAWRHYVLQLKEAQKEVVMQRLKADVLDAYEDYTWSRKAARAAGDYKETRLAGADHLDRVGATEKPRETQPMVTVYLQSKTFAGGNLMKELPEVTAEEIVVENPEIE